MSTYTTVSIVLDQATKVASASNISSAEVSRQIERVESIVNAKLGNLYTVPFTSGNVPPIIETITADLAMHRILRTTAFKTSGSKKDWMDLFKESDEMLGMIASGEMALPNSAGAIIQQVTNVLKIGSNTKNYKPTFDMRDPVKWHVDPDRIEDLDDAET